MSWDVISDLAPTGVVRAGINLSNFLLVTGRNPAGDPEGIAPDLAREVATRLGVPVKYVPFKSPSELADAAVSGVWDIGLIGAEPQRAETIAFSPAYAEIEATYLLPSGSPLKTLANVDAPGVRIAVTGRAAYGLWLDRNIKHAELVRSETLDSAYEDFVSGKLDALAGLRPRLLSDLENCPARASSTGGLPRFSRRSVRPAKTSPVRRSCATLSKTSKPPGSSHDLSNAIRSVACRSRLGPKRDRLIHNVKQRPLSSSPPGKAVRRTASLRSPITRWSMLTFSKCN
jgi:polar amino acid transport system substrate-binding protein